METKKLNFDQLQNVEGGKRAVYNYSGGICIDMWTIIICIDW